MAIELATAYVSLVTDTSKIPKDIDRAFGQAEKSAGRAGKSMGGALSSTFGKAVKAAGALGAGFTLGSAVTKGFSNALDQGTAQKTLAGLYNDAGKARVVLDDLRKVASKSPIDYTTYQKAAESLAYTGVEGGRAVGILKNVGLAITAVGGSSESMDQANNALAKMVNAGKVGLDSLQQLSGSGVPIISGLAKHFGVSMDEINKMASNGAIGLEDVLSVMENGTGDTFQSMLKAGDEASKSFGNQWKIAKDNVISAIGQGLSPVLESLAPKLAGIGGAVASGVGKLPDVFSAIGSVGSTVFDALRPAISSIVDSLSSMWETAKSLVDPLMSVGEAMAPFAKAAIGAAIGTVVAAFKTMSVVVKPLAAVLRGIGDFAKNHTTTFRVLAGIVLGAVGAWKAYRLAVAATKAVQLGMTAASYGAAGATYAVGGATRVYNALMKKQAIQTAVVTAAQKARAAATYVVAGAQRALNLAMRMNPIGMIITALVALGAGLVLLYNKSETFRNIVQSVWQSIQTAVLWAWENVLRPVWDAIKIALQAVGYAFVWVWNNVIKPAWDALGAGISWVWTNIIQPVWNALKFALSLVGIAFQFYWNNVIKPAWNALGTGISWVWVNIIQPVWNALKAALSAVGTAFQWVWNNIIKPAWDALGAGISWVWNNVIKPAWTVMKDELNSLGNFFKWIWNNIIKPAWDALGTGISWVIDNVIKPAWNGMKTALESVGNFFSTVVDGIRNVWDSLKGFLATPINFLIGVVWNKGILKAWNTVADFLPGLPTATELPQLSEGKQFATGGAVFGPGGERGDKIPAWLSNNEHVFDAGDVRALGGQRAVYALRALVERGIPFTWDTVKGLSAMSGKSVRQLRTGDTKTDGEPADVLGMLHGVVPGYKDGGAPTEPHWHAQIARAHEWAQARHGRPYVLGGDAAGGGGTDCSGFMSGIADVIQGGDGHRQWATMAFNNGGNTQQPTGPQGFVAGLSEGFSIGIHNGGAAGGHTAGTLSGVRGFSTVNVESGGSPSMVKYADGAAGADDGYFETHYHLPIGADGAFESGGGPSRADKEGFIVKKIHEIIEKFTGPIKDAFGSVVGTPPPELFGIPPAFMDLVTHGAVDFLVDKVKNLGDLLGAVWDKTKDFAKKTLSVLTFGLFDQGGWLQPGMNLIANKTGQPEPVLNPEQWRLLEGLLESMTGGKPLDMEHLADVSATFQKKTGDIVKSGMEEFRDDALGQFGITGFDRWTKVGDEWQKAMDARRKMDEDKRKKDQEATESATSSDEHDKPVLIPAEGAPAQQDTYVSGDLKIGTAEVGQTQLPDLDSGTAGSGSVKDAVKKAFEPYGWNVGDQWSAADWIIGKESTWNPTARNPSSGAFGLFQFLGSTKDQYLPDENPDPFVQGKAGARYIQDRYGTPIAAKAFWEQNGWYDNGGWLQPGVTLVENRTGKPEPVFSPSQWATLEANVMGGDGGRGPRTIIRQEVTVADQRSAVRELSRQARRDMMVHG